MVGDHLVRAMVGDGLARVLWVRAPDTISAMLRAHGARGRVAEAGCELAVASLVMSAWVKGDERVTLQLQAESPSPVSFVGEVDAEGAFRGRISPRTMELEGPISGLLYAMKANADREMYRGVTQVEHEHVGDALAGHLATSDQIDVFLRIRVEEGVPMGLLVERLPHPGADEEAHERFVQHFGRMSELSLVEIERELEGGTLGGLAIRRLEERSIRWQCRCSEERVRSMLTSLGYEELRLMIEEDGRADVECHFCNTSYAFDRQVLQDLLSSMSAVPMSGSGEHDA